MHDTASFLAPDGRLAARIAGWESRPQQVAMADVVATIEIAKLLKHCDEGLFDTLHRQRTKRTVSGLVNLDELTPLRTDPGSLLGFAPTLI